MLARIQEDNSNPGFSHLESAKQWLAAISQTVNGKVYTL
ncbi:hypothetical protein FHW36_102528 [Chitinophaga polysaccharea]|uniref:Uncharacterized protein n=1 Tax=Chitinophaga polysaccharea TaxID=1293035 RepID=A0A561PXC9_9BACT|nr:hypothetical protein FHW36_102528 [Chitinophaga polysaccharea]